MRVSKSFSIPTNPRTTFLQQRDILLLHRAADNNILSLLAAAAATAANDVCENYKIDSIGGAS